MCMRNVYGEDLRHALTKRRQHQHLISCGVRHNSVTPSSATIGFQLEPKQLSVILDVATSQALCKSLKSSQPIKSTGT